MKEISTFLSMAVRSVIQNPLYKSSLKDVENKMKGRSGVKRVFSIEDRTYFLRIAERKFGPRIWRNQQRLKSKARNAAGI